MDKAYNLTLKAFQKAAAVPPVNVLKVFLVFLLFASMAVLGLEIGAVSTNQTLPLLLSTVSFPAVPAGSLEKELAKLQYKLQNEKIAFMVDDVTFPATRKECGMQVDLLSLKEKLVSLGRTGNPVKDFPAWYASASGTLTVPVPYTLQKKNLEAVIRKIKTTVERTPRDATVDFTDKKILPDVKGIKINEKIALETVEKKLPEFNSAILFPAVVTKPKVSLEDVKDLSVSNVVSSFETSYNAGITNRVFNLRLAAKKLDGVIMKPGDVISYNEIVGNRNEENGFKLAPQIVKGELVPGIGGGACQISSTLHAASLYAGLQTVTRTNHSLPSHYIGMGLDATVFYPYLDLKIKNTLPFPVAIHTNVDKGKVRMEIYGKQKLYEVSFKRSIVGVYPHRVETVKDSSLPAGKVVVEKKGYTGYMVKRARVFKQGNHTWEEQLPNDFYPPQKEVRRVGTAVAAKPIIKKLTPVPAALNTSATN